VQEKVNCSYDRNLIGNLSIMSEGSKWQHFEYKKYADRINLANA